VSMQRVTDLADPRRCKGSAAEGQCVNVAADGSDYCVACGGVDRGPARRMRKYLLASAEDQGLLDRYASDDELKTLREEIALVRMMVQRTLATAQTDVEKINAYSKVNTLLLTLERLMKTCHSLEQSLGQLVGKPALLRLGQRLCRIVIDRLEGLPNYEQLVDAMIADIDAAFHDLDNTAPEIEAE
jgi:hypothetical protein